MSAEYPTTVSGVFAGRLQELAKGSSGAALAVTLAFFLPIYLMVIGIFGVGEMVRNKIELQNAADAAAYSAAVVQADYLSRIATVNKAMAWTYVDLQLRSLDLAMDLFTVNCLAKYAMDVNMCIRENQPCHMHVPGVNWNVGTDILVVDMALLFLGSGLGIPGLETKFNGQGLVTRMVPVQSFYTALANISGKGAIINTPKVLKYSYDIGSMMTTIYKLKEEYPKKVKETAQQIAIANMIECKDDFYVKVHQGDPMLSFLFMIGTEDNEKSFIAFADPTLKDFTPKKVFGNGTDDWIVRKGGVGFWRVYKQTETHLYAEWDWFWTKWVHVDLGEIQLHLPPFAPGGAYDHGHRKFHGYDGIVPLIQRDLPVGLLVVPAIPITLLPTFFGKSGSITVAIVRKTSNPLSLFSWGGRSMTASGVLSAFNPGVAGGNRPEFMCAIASARAGYKQYEKDKEKKFKSSDYTVGYVQASREKAWNLAETDWDAVMLPVRHAWGLCAGVGNAQTFAPGGGDILKEILLDKKGWIDANGKDVDANKLPDWEKLQPPGGMIGDDKSKDKKLDWEKLSDYLGH